MKDCVHEMGICYLWILSIVINKKFGISLPTRLRIIIDFFSTYVYLFKFMLPYHDCSDPPKIITQKYVSVYSRLNILRIQIVYLASAID